MFNKELDSTSTQLELTVGYFCWIVCGRNYISLTETEFVHKIKILYVCGTNTKLEHRGF